MVGPKVTLEKIPQLDTTKASMDIDLIGIAKNNNETSMLNVVMWFYQQQKKKIYIYIIQLNYIYLLFYYCLLSLFVFLSHRISCCVFYEL